VYLDLDKETKQLLEEISAISGIQKNVVREVWEFTALRWVEELSKNPEKRAKLPIPFLGEASLKYEGDEKAPSGGLYTQVSAFISLSDMMRTLVGHIHDSQDTVFHKILEEKISNALENAIDSEG
jgi:hypothetical protein